MMILKKREGEEKQQKKQNGQIKDVSEHSKKKNTSI